MYASFFGLDEKPFAITPDPRYLYLRRRHAEALDVGLQIEQGVAAGIITAEEAEKMRLADEKIMALINVDDFAPEDLRPLVRDGRPGRRKRRPQGAADRDVESSETAEA